VICPTFVIPAVDRDAGTSPTPAVLSRLQGVTVTARQLFTALICTVALTAVAASAAVAAPLGVLGVSGSTGTGDGQFRGIGGVAVNDSTGDVYVVDLDGQRVERYSASGVFQDAFGVPGTGNGQFAFETVGFNAVPSLAIDQSDGSVYVADPGNDRVQKFSAAGAYVSQFGTSGAGNGQLSKPIAVGVDPNDGAVYVVDNRNYRVQKFSSAGAYVSQFGEAGEGDGQFGTDRGPTRIGVDSAGRVYVLDQDGSRRVQRFTAAGVFDQVLTSGDTLGNIPFDLAVDSGGDHVFVGGYINGTVTEFDGTGTTVDVHLNGASIQALSGIGLRAGALAFAAGSDGFDGSSQPRVFRVGAVTAATLSVQPTTDIGGGSATLNATINPNGAPNVSYRFEVTGDFGTTWTSVPVPDASVGDGTTDVPVSQVVNGLKPNTFYFFQLVVTKQYNGTTTSEPFADFFQTLKIAPTVSDVSADPTDYGAKLSAKVNANGVESTYQFEYGPTTAYGKSFPLIAASAGASYDPIKVTRTIGGLEPNTTYHFRIVSTNEAGTSEGVDQTFTTTSPANPSEDHGNGRAFEQVSQVDKAGGGVSAIDTAQASVAGGAIAYASSAAFPGSSTSNLHGYYISKRDPAGWSTAAIDPPQVSAAQVALLGTPTRVISPDLGAALQFSTRSLVPGGIEDGNNYYRRDNATGNRTLVFGHGADQALADDIGNLGSVFEPAASDDVEHVVFQTTRQLLPEAAPAAFNVYESVDGALRLVNYLPDGTVDPRGARLGANSASVEAHRISTDGRRVYFTVADVSGGPLYLRQDGEVTIPVSVSQRPGDPADAASALFQGASADGRVAYFVSTRPLTTDAVGGIPNLYRWNADTRELSRMPMPEGLDVPEVIRISTNGDRAYVRLSRGGLTATVFMWSGTSLSKVADVDDSEAIADLGAAISPSGRYLLFTTVARPTGFDNSVDTDACVRRAISTGGSPIISRDCSEVYRYDADSDTLVCATCRAEGENGPSEMVQQSALTVSGHFATQVLDDGRAFFTSDEALSARDVNGRKDVYEWTDGALRLVSTGVGGADARFADASPDGRDVFFTTAARLVAQDIDSSTDMYDARLGGGIAAQNVAPSVGTTCDADSCQGSPGGRPGASSTHSETQPEGGDATAPTRNSKVAANVVVQKPAVVHGALGTLRIKVAGKGRIRVSGPGLVIATRKVARSGTYTVPVRLSKLAQRALTRSGATTKHITVQFVSSGGESQTVRVRVSFKRKTAARPAVSHGKARKDGQS
jgi:hypothetical protein